MTPVYDHRRVAIGKLKSDFFSADVTIPAAVERVRRQGVSVIPQTGGEPKVPMVKWRELQSRSMTDEELTDLIVAKGDPGTWALATGHKTVVVLDFDGEAGRKLFKKWGLQPNVVTRNGGFHLWVKDVPFPVKPGHVRGYPGLEVKGDRSSATFFGAVTEGPKKGTYQLRSTKAVSVNSLPFEVRRVIENHKVSVEELNREEARRAPDEAESGPDIGARLLANVLLAMDEGREGYSGRNEAGFSFFCQLRDNRVPERLARRFVPTWVTMANELRPDPDDLYTDVEAFASLEQSYSQPARDPSLTRVLLRTERGLMRLSNVQHKPVAWLWQGRIPLAKLTMLDGDPERGKSCITTDIAARFSAGSPMPDGQHVGQGNVLFIAAEDAVDDTIAPRFRAAEGDPECAFFYPLPRDEETGRVRPLTIPEDLDDIEDRIRDDEIKLVIVDPITAFLSARISTNNDASVRKALTPLKEVAETNGCAFILVRHLNKDSGESKALYRGGGSIAFTGAARSAMVVAEHPDEEGVLVLARVKGNVAKPVPNLTYRLESWEGDETVPKVVWLGTTDLTANDLFKKTGRSEAPARDEAERIIVEILANGPVPSKELQEEVFSAGVKKATYERARESLGVTATRVRDVMGKTNLWYSYLPGQIVDGEFVM